MDFRYPDKEIHNVAELIDAISKDTKTLKEPVWFRGHKNKKYKLIPSIFEK